MDSVTASFLQDTLKGYNPQLGSVTPLSAYLQQGMTAGGELTKQQQAAQDLATKQQALEAARARSPYDTSLLQAKLGAQLMQNQLSQNYLDSEAKRLTPPTILPDPNLTGNANASAPSTASRMKQDTGFADAPAANGTANPSDAAAIDDSIIPGYDKDYSGLMADGNKSALAQQLGIPAPGQYSGTIPAQPFSLYGQQ